MADEKKTTSDQNAKENSMKNGAEETKKPSNAMTPEALEGMETAPLPESTPPPGQPGFHWGM